VISHGISVLATPELPFAAAAVGVIVLFMFFFFRGMR